ncbi:MAG: hypothetical protein HYY24_16945 [Verrucomicrobia bacterium]|nr:hypothetical protein [Verrucomicrobiota bacterium]
MNPIYSAALEVQAVCEASAWRFCFIGGVAVQRWGEPRLTADVDLTLFTGFGREEQFIASLAGQFALRRPDAVPFALRTRVLLLRASNGVGLDVALGASPFEVASIERSSPFPIAPGQALITCSAEDLIVHKTIANREKDWLDVESVLIRQRGKLDLELVRTTLRPLLELKEEPELAHLLEHKITTCARKQRRQQR